MSLGYEFAPIDVSIITHDKVLDIERRHRLAAFGLWCWGQCYARTHRTSGILRRSAVLASLAASVGDLQKLAAELVRVGLWIAVDNGWSIHNFEKKSAGNQRSEAPGSSTERVRRLRERRAAEVASVTDVTACNGTVAVTETSTSPSYSVSSSSLGEPERGPPDWFAEVVTAVCDDTGEKFGVPEAWLRYSGHRATKGIPTNAQDARYWLGTVMVPEARKERRAESDRKVNRDATAKRFADHAPKYERPTGEQGGKFQAELKRRLEEEAKKGAA